MLFGATLVSLHNLSSQLHLSISQSLFPAIHGLTHINCSPQTCPQKFNHQLLRTGALRAFTERSLAILLPWHSTFDPQDEGILALLPSVALFLVSCLLIVRRKVIPCAQSSMTTVLRMLVSYLTLQIPNVARAHQSATVSTARLRKVGFQGKYLIPRRMLRRQSLLMINRRGSLSK